MEMFDLSQTANALGVKKVYRARLGSTAPGPPPDQELFYDPMIDIQNELLQLKKEHRLRQRRSIGSNGDETPRPSKQLLCMRCFTDFGESTATKTVKIRGESRVIDEIEVNSRLKIVTSQRVAQDFDLKKHENTPPTGRTVGLGLGTMGAETIPRQRWKPVQPGSKQRVRVFDEEWDTHVGLRPAKAMEWKLKKGDQSKWTGWNQTSGISDSEVNEINFKVNCAECLEFVGVYNFQTNKCLIFS